MSAPAAIESSAPRNAFAHPGIRLWRRLSIGGQHTVRGKVLAVVAWTTTTALLVAGAALLARDVSVYRQARVAALTTEAKILALSVAPDLAFDDQRSAVRALSALQANPALIAAALYGPTGTLFARYVRAGTGVPLSLLTPKSSTIRVASSYIEIFQPVLQGHEVLGGLYLRARYDLEGRFLAYCEILLVVFVGSLIVALLLSSLLRRSITAPLDAMAGVAQQVVEQRDFGLRARKVTDDEIGLVVDAFNKMLDEVQAHAEALERSHAAVQASVEAAKRTEKELRATEAALREADERKDVFIATLAHELRNPLAPIRIAARLLAAPSLKPAELANTRAIIARQVQHMALLLDDLLDVSRITRGALELKRDYVALDDCIAAAVETARPLIDTKRQKLILEASPVPIILDADPLRLTQIVTNLLTNAAKYTDPEGDILVRTRVDGGRVTISVKDSGIGVPPEALPKLFEMFSQLQTAGARTEGGLGIGLALVKGLVLLHGGEVEARSAGLNQGSEFLVHLPAASSTQGSVPLVAEAAESPARRRRRILVTDDNRDAAESLALLLKIAGHDVHVAYSGSEALTAAAAVSPEFILLDIGMPGQSGYEVARCLRKRGVQAVLIAITGWGQESDREQAKAAGFDHHMTKPIDPVALENYLDEVGAR